jgi:uncharacterized protein with HEPN domain
LHHILDAIKKIEGYTRNLNKEEFVGDSLIQDGVIRQIEIIGEAVKHVSKSLRKRYSEIPWQDIAGMRDQLIHEYFGVEVNIVWNTITDDIPPFKTAIEEILRSM